MKIHIRPPGRQLKMYTVIPHDAEMAEHIQITAQVAQIDPAEIGSEIEIALQYARCSACLDDAEPSAFAVFINNDLPRPVPPSDYKRVFAVKICHSCCEQKTDPEIAADVVFHLNHSPPPKPN